MTVVQNDCRYDSRDPCCITGQRLSQAKNVHAGSCSLFMCALNDSDDLGIRKPLVQQEFYSDSHLHGTVVIGPFAATATMGD